MRIHPLSIVIAAGSGIALLGGSGAFAQGCIVGRQCTPGSFGSGSFLMPKQLDLGFSYRSFRADRHYNGVVEQTQRHDIGNYVINRQNIWDYVVGYGLDRRSNLVLDIPYVDSGWSVPMPIGSATVTPGDRRQLNGKGIGDISLIWKTWLRDPQAHGSGNIALGVGLKAPTGKDNVKSVYPNLDGTNPTSKPVDQSIQPGDGGWGIPTSLEAYTGVGKSAVAFVTANYLISPRDTNGVPSIITNLGLNPPAAGPSMRVNSVPDQYLYRIGVGGAIPSVPGLSASLAWRKEGVPDKDLIGGSHGWRRPGYSTSIEPSLTYQKRDTAYTLSYPITRFRNRIPTVPDGTPLPGDSTFADNQIVLNISHRLNLH